MTWNDTCNNCSRSNHWAKDYSLPPRRGGQAHVTQAGEEDAALFLVHGCVEPQQEAGEGVKGPSFPLSASTGSTHLHLDEPRAHAFLGKGADDDKING